MELVYVRRIGHIVYMLCRCTSTYLVGSWLSSIDLNSMLLFYCAIASKIRLYLVLMTALQALE